jgi:predicted nucleic acid-binding protein
MGLILLDSPLIAGFLDADDSLHEVTVARLKELLGTHQLVASVLSYGEVMDGICLAHHPQEQVEGFFDAFVKDLLPVDMRVAGSAARLARKHRSLPMPDALILGTAQVHPEIETILCADPTWPKITGLRPNVELLKARPQVRA